MSKNFRQLAIFIFTVTVFLFCRTTVSAQSNNFLERKITVSFSGERTDEVLNEIAGKGQFQFSYNPDVVDVSGRFTGTFNNIPVREILNEVFGGTIEYRQRGKHLILYRKKQKPAESEKVADITFTGYVRDTSGAAIQWVSIYDKESLESTVSNDYGYYRIRFNDKQLPVKLNFSKQGYNDTALVLDKSSLYFNNIILGKVYIPAEEGVSYDSLASAAERTASSFFGSDGNNYNDLNITDTLYRKWQASAIPMIGTNGKLSGNVINDYSFNLLGGYSLGTNVLEVSGFLNLNRGDVKYVQLAGFGNLNGGDVNGVRLSGFANVAGGDVSAVQAAGFCNATMGYTEKLQLAGAINYCNKGSKGFQASGLTNITNGNKEGTQITSFANVVTDTLKGTQLGFINYSRSAEGSQVGFINVSLNTTKTPVGFLSYVHNGYHKIEVSADEVYSINTFLRTGTKGFHNIIGAGISPSSDSLQLWHFGYGFGSTVDLGKRAALDFDLTCSQIVKGNNLEKIDLLPKFYFGTDIKLGKVVSLSAGLTVNARITSTNYDSYPDIFSYYEPNIFYENTWKLDHVNMKMWLGAKAGIRFL